MNNFVGYLPKLASCVAGTTGECNDTSALEIAPFALIAIGVIAGAAVITVLVVSLLKRRGR